MGKQSDRKVVWTDLPFLELGDDPMTKGPLREVLLVEVRTDGTSSIQLPTGSIAVVRNDRLHLTPTGLYN